MKNEKKKLISEILVLSESKVNEILEKIKKFHIFFYKIPSIFILKCLVCFR